MLVIKVIVEQLPKETNAKKGLTLMERELQRGGKGVGGGVQGTVTGQQ